MKRSKPFHRPRAQAIRLASGIEDHWSRTIEPSATVWNVAKRPAMVTHWHVREPRSGECTMPSAASPCLKRNGHGFETVNRERLHSPHVGADRPCLHDSRLVF